MEFSTQVSRTHLELLTFPPLIYMCKALCGAPGKVSPNKRNYKQDIIKARKGSHGFTETRQKDHGIKIFFVEGGRNEHTLFRWWTYASGKG